MASICNKKVIDFDKAFISKHPENYEGYAALYTNSLKEFANWDDPSITPPCVEVLLKIRHCCKVIYRKGIAYPATGLNKEVIMLGYRSQKQLGITNGVYVKVKRASWFLFLWNHHNPTVRYPFRFALFLGALSLLLSAISLYVTLHEVRCC